MRSLFRIWLVALVVAIPMAVQAGGGAATSAAAEAQATRDEIKTTLGFVPGFIRAVPDYALPGAWEEMNSRPSTRA
jgi:hypothetical protein